MPYPPDYRAAVGLRPEANDHDAADHGASSAFGEQLTDNDIDGGLQQQIEGIREVLEHNQAEYANRRAAIGLSPTQLRVISDVGREDLFSIGLRRRGTGAPIFRYFPPKTSESIRPFRGEIKWVVMHSFGRGFDARALSRGARTVAIDPTTGHNPRRFINGVNNVVNGDAHTAYATGTRPAQAAIHHCVSLRGDLINSVSWDTRCVHGEGGGYHLGINDSSIGIEHEEWYAAPAPRPGQPVAQRFREIEDHGPYSEETYACDAFILKKLSAYTGLEYTRFLGMDETCRENIRNGVVGTFCHASTSTHADPGGEYFLPPEYALRTTSFSSMPETRDRAGAWERRVAIWYNDIPDGTLISAWARIFEKVARLRSFDLQTEVFDPTLAGNGILDIHPPAPSGTYTRVLAEEAARDRLSGVDRASRLAASSRVGLYAAAESSSAAVSTALARASSRLGDIAEQQLRLPVITNALGFDFSTGQWSNNTTRSVVSDVNTDPVDGGSPTSDTGEDSVVPST